MHSEFSCITFHFLSKLTLLVLQEWIWKVCVSVCVECGKRARCRCEAYYAPIIGNRNLSWVSIRPRNRLHKSRSFFERASKNRQEKKTTISFVNWWSSFSLAGRERKWKMENGLWLCPLCRRGRFGVDQKFRSDEQSSSSASISKAMAFPTQRAESHVSRLKVNIKIGVLLSSSIEVASQSCVSLKPTVIIFNP